MPDTIIVLTRDQYAADIRQASHEGAQNAIDAVRPVLDSLSALALSLSRDALTTTQAARIAGVSPDTITRWIRDGRLKATQVLKRSGDGYTYSIAPADLDKARRGA